MVLARITGYSNWKRATAGHEQVYGDLVPVDEHGRLAWDRADMFYIECKVRTQITRGEVDKILQEVEEKRRGLPWLLLIKANNGPINAICDSTVRDRIRSHTLEDEYVMGSFFIL